MKMWVLSLIAGPHPGGALRIKEKEDRKLHVTLQAIIAPVECAPRLKGLSGLPRKMLQLHLESSSYSIAESPLFLS